MENVMDQIVPNVEDVVVSGAVHIESRWILACSRQLFAEWLPYRLSSQDVKKH